MCSLFPSPLSARRPVLLPGCPMGWVSPHWPSWAGPPEQPGSSFSNKVAIESGKRLLYAKSFFLSISSKIRYHILTQQNTPRIPSVLYNCISWRPYKTHYLWP